MTTAAIIKYKDTISGEQVSLSVTDIKKLFCPLATDQEAMLFLELCRHQGLNPFVRDAYLLKYDEKRPATMVVGKDSFTKRAEAHPQFAGMAAGVVVQKENGEIENRKGSLILEGGEGLADALGMLGQKIVSELCRSLPPATRMRFWSSS